MFRKSSSVETEDQWLPRAEGEEVEWGDWEVVAKRFEVSF